MKSVRRNEEVLKAPQVSKQLDGLGLRTSSLFVEFFLLGSNESIPRQGSLFQQEVIAKFIAKLEHLDNQERKRKLKPGTKRRIEKNIRKKEGMNEKRKRRKKKGKIKQRELKWNPPACRRVLWILFVRSCTVCFVFGLCLDCPLGADFCLV
jgi:hypothetical protein